MLDYFLREPLLIFQRRNDKEPFNIIGPSQASQIMQIDRRNRRRDSLRMLVINRIMQKPDIEPPLQTGLHLRAILSSASDLSSGPLKDKFRAKWPKFII
jgi:hypothetical protein